jgi:hypothetical protein
MLEFNIIPVGLPAAMAELSAFPKAVDKGGKKGLIDIAPLIVEEAKANAPKKTGDLIESIDWEETSDGIRIFAGVPYAYYQEAGFTHYWSGKWIPGKYYITNAIRKYVDGGEVENSVVKKINEERREIAVAASAASMLGSLLGGAMAFASLAMIGFVGLMSTRL